MIQRIATRQALLYPKRGRRSLKIPSGLGSRLLFGLGVILIAIGIWMAIGTLPISLVSIVFFAPIGGLGLLIGYKLKRIRSALLWGLGVAAWGYLWYAIDTDWDLQFHTATNYFTKTTMTLFFYSLITVVPIAVLGTLVIAWLARKKLSPDSITFSAFFKLAPITLLIAAPFIIGGPSDYNYRGGTNPQVINLKIVDKWIDRDVEWTTEGLYDVFIVKGETLDGSSWFSFPVSADFYNENDIGSYCWISVHNGALGYPYISRARGNIVLLAIVRSYLPKPNVEQYINIIPTPAPTAVPASPPALLMPP